MISRNSFGSLLLLSVASLCSTVEGSNTEYLNVYGEALQPCSQDGMALTGYTRSGYCVERDDDQGSHHICIDLSSLTTDENFCTVTGQSDWCSSQDMACHSDPYDASCPVENWCVCQWAFSSYVLAAGCGNIQTVVCESINLQALLAYQTASSQWNAPAKYQAALECLLDRCGIDADDVAGYVTASGLVLTTTGSRGRIVTIGAVLFAAASMTLLVRIGIYKRNQMTNMIDLNEKDGIVGLGKPMSSLLQTET